MVLDSGKNKQTEIVDSFLYGFEIILKCTFLLQVSAKWRAACPVLVIYSECLYLFGTCCVLYCKNTVVLQ
jgi:hypothetical protein